jgi:beta-lactamase class A
MISYKSLLAVLFVLLACEANGQVMRLGRAFADSIAVIGATSGGHAGIDLMEIEGKKGYSIHGDDQFPMLSVFKFPLALYFLHQADLGKLDLGETLSIKKKDWKKMASPLLSQYQSSSIRLSIRDLLIAVIQISDNVACDVLLARAGGPGVVDNYIHSLGINGINIAVSETQMAADPKKMYENWSKPSTMNMLLQFFFQGHILSDSNTAMLLQWMTNVTTGPHRLKGLLPAGTVVAHKTGTSGTSADGLTTATNDVGIITLPNGHHLCITVFIMDSRADETTREGAIARVAKLAYDSFSAAKLLHPGASETIIPVPSKPVGPYASNPANTTNPAATGNQANTANPVATNDLANASNPAATTQP